MSLFLEAAHGHNTPHAPIWIMRQAGRYLSEYRALKERYSFWELCRTPELTTEITLQPVRRFGMDAAILFQDIMTPLPPMGLEIDFSPGPVFKQPVRSAEAVAALRVPETDEIAPFVADAIRLIRAESPVPLIGFGGAPLTLATYIVQGSGSKDYDEFRQFLRYAPDAAHALLEKLTELSIRYLKMQLGAGAQAVQLFDSWAGALTPADYERFVLPASAKVLAGVADLGVPRIHFGVATGELLGLMHQAGAEVVGVDWRVPLDTARSRLAPDVALQGNLDPALVVAGWEATAEGARDVLRRNDGHPGHVFNLGHGVLPETEPEVLEQLVALVHTEGRADGQPSLLDTEVGP